MSAALCLLCSLPVCAITAPEPVALVGPGGVRAVFSETPRGWMWTALEDTASGQAWTISGPGCAFKVRGSSPEGTEDGQFPEIATHSDRIVLTGVMPALSLAVNRFYSFCEDGRTLRIETAIRALERPLILDRLRLLKIRVENEDFRLMGPQNVSSPVFGQVLFTGIEHPVASCRVEGDTLDLAQVADLEVTTESTGLANVIVGVASQEDLRAGPEEGMRRAFLRYLDTVRVKPRDLHVHYNDWWTAPVPSSESFVLSNIAALKQGLFDTTGFFFDSYALDAGWSNPHSAWEISAKHFPRRFDRIREALAAVHARPGLWISPSSLYPFALDNHWLESAGYEVMPHRTLGYSACTGIGGKYQQAFRDALLRYQAEAGLAHVKFDGFVPECDASTHGHPAGEASRFALAEGLIQVFDALRARDPGIALEPTCFGYQPSPWWLMHTPFIIGPFGDDSPPGRCPCPEWIESMTTARDIKNLEGRDAFLMPSSALQCFDIIVQCPGAFQNHAVMSIGRGRWFVSCYINPQFMDTKEWGFFSDLIAWARHNREVLQEPLPIGGDPAKREAYGYAFLGARRSLYCLRNPWIEETTLALEPPECEESACELRMLYPRRELLARQSKEMPLTVGLGPYETVFAEVLPSSDETTGSLARPQPRVDWRPAAGPTIERVRFSSDVPAFGPSWTTPVGESEELVRFAASGNVRIDDATDAELCVLAEGTAELASSLCRLTVDGARVTPSMVSSVGAFAASGAPPEEYWTWFLAPLHAGASEISMEMLAPSTPASFGLYVRGYTRAGTSLAPTEGPAFPTYQPDCASWSRTLVPLTPLAVDDVAARVVPRPIERIDGVYADALDWSEAAAGWGEVRRNASVMEQTMRLGGRSFLRGLGTHAPSRIVFSVPEGCVFFAATIGKDQEVPGGSVVFVVQADGHECYRSPVMSNATAPTDIHIPVAGVDTLTLLVEDAGDGIAADHADWAEARFLRQEEGSQGKPSRGRTD